MRRLPRPEDLLDELGITQPADIHVEAIAQYCGATIVYEPLDGCEAQILGRGDRAIITVKRDALRPRQRFSAAHELGHWMRDRGKLASFSCSGPTFVAEWSREGADNPERRANRFAADLLLPRPLFKADAYQRDMTFATVKDLADRYETSFTATAIRLVELGSFPAMLICTRGRRRKWFVPGPDVEGVWPVAELQQGTVAHDLLDGSRHAPGPVQVAADQWFDHPNARRYEVCEDSRRVGDFIISLLWWKDESQLIDLMGAADEID